MQQTQVQELNFFFFDPLNLIGCQILSKELRCFPTKRSVQILGSGQFLLYLQDLVGLLGPISPHFGYQGTCFPCCKQHLWFLQQHFRLTHPSVFFCTEDHDKPPLSSIWCFFVFVVWVRWRSFLQLQHREHQVLSTMSLEKQGIWRHGIFVGCVCALTIKGLDNSLKLWIVSSSYF